MNTTEQLDGTYYFYDLPNLTPHELLFWVPVDETQDKKPLTIRMFTESARAGRWLF